MGLTLAERRYPNSYCTCRRPQCRYRPIDVGNGLESRDRCGRYGWCYPASLDRARFLPGSLVLLLFIALLITFCSKTRISQFT